MIKFEEHEGKLFRMLDKPVPLTDDTELPCLIRLIQDDSPMGRYVKQCWGHDKVFMRGKYTIYGINADKAAKVGVVRDTPISIHMLEIIGTFVEEGSKEWALYQMMKGEKVTFRDYPNRTLKLVNGYIQDSISDGFWNRKSGNEFLSYASSPGWQIYKEPKHESQYKVGDWVEHKESKEQATIRRIMSYGAIEIEFAYSTESDIYQANDFHNDFRKLSPSEVVIRIGCLSGTIAKSCDPNYFLMLHSRPVTNCNHSMIRFSALDTETRKIVEGLLEAQRRGDIK